MASALLTLAVGMDTVAGIQPVSTIMREFLPIWAHPWLEVITIGLQIIVILVVASLLRVILVRFISKVGRDNMLPLELVVGGRRVLSILLFAGALLLILDRIGVSGTVLWTAFTGFATVAAVAFFAAWSVLSNIFCSLLIYTTRPFGLHDRIELLESGDKPGLGGEVLDIRLIYTTLKENPEDAASPILQIPNSLFFQRTMRIKTLSRENSKIAERAKTADPS